MSFKDKFKLNRNSDKAEDSFIPEPSEGQEEEANTKKEIPIEAVQHIIPVKKIYRGVVQTSDGRYIKNLEVSPVNFSLRSAEEQNSIIHQFASWLRIAPPKLHFKVVTKKADSRRIIDNVEAAAAGEPNPKCRELADNLVNFISELSGQEALDRRFYIGYEYAPTSSRQKTEDEIIDEMNETARKIKASLARCGNEVTTPKNEDYFQAEIFYQFYNRESCTKEPFSDRVIRVTSDMMKVDGLQEGVDPYPDVPVVNYIAPRGIDFTNHDFFVCDGLYYTIRYITRSGYPTHVFGGWMSSLIESGDGIDVDIILHKKNRAEARDKVAQKLKFNRIKQRDRSDTDADFEELADATYSAAWIKNELASGQDFYDMFTFITISSDTIEGLKKREEYIDDFLRSCDIETSSAAYRLEDAFRIVTPALCTNQELMNFAKRNVLTNGAASMYPFTSCEICDEKGIVLGINRRYSSLVNIDIFNPKKYKNSNIAILGTSGAGKTFTELVCAMRMRIQGIQTFIIAPDKAHEFTRACTHIGGAYIRISPGSKTCINVMEIRPIVNPIAEYLDEIDAAERDSWLAQKTSQLLTFFHILIPDITNEEEQLVDEAIIKTYNLFGITHDNDSIYEPGTKKKQIRHMPIIGDLYNVLKENQDTRRIANILGRFVTGSAASFNQQTNVDLTNKFTVFDLQDLQGNMKAVGMFVVMDFLWSRIKENRTDKKAIFIDEGWQLIGASTDSRAADFVYRIFKIARGYGTSAIFATQDISDLFAFQDGKYGKAIISNSKIKIVLGLEPQEAKCVKEVLQLTKSEMQSITSFDRGEALLCANNNKVPVFIRASTLEEELITTDPEQLRNIVNQRKEERAQAELAKHFSRSNFAETHVEESAKEAATTEHKQASEVPIGEGQETGPAQKDALKWAPDGAKRPEKIITQDLSTPAPESFKASEMSDPSVMSALAMDQLAASSIVRDANGQIISFETDPIVPVDDKQYESSASVFVGAPDHQNSSDYKTEIPIYESEEDEALVDAEDADENAEIPSFTTSLEGGRRYDRHPPADF